MRHTIRIFTAIMALRHPRNLCIGIYTANSEVA